MADEKASFEQVQSKLIGTVLDKSKIEVKDDGRGNKLSYLSWAWAWAEVLKVCPDASYEIERFGEERLPYQRTPEGFMVWTKVTMKGVTREMWLPVMDSHNLTMLSEPWKKATKRGEIAVERATMTDINKTIMRCLVKNIAMFGLGLNIYAGEDTPKQLVAESDVMEAPKPIFCKECGKEIAPYKNMSAQDFATNTLASYGKELCLSCANKAKEERKRKAEEENKDKKE